ncbi:MAG: MFS transporter [Candidatus Rokubacteria bacterium]|nr:MFS transporter [Candidatus Rokubacteria bacterium]
MADAAAVSLVTDAAERVRPNARLIALLALGHMVIDVSQGSLPAVLPFLKATHHLSYAEAGMVMLVANLTSSIIQPLFGYLSDQTARRWLLPLSVLTAGVGLGLTGVAPGYGALLALVLVMGLGVAAYHPEGYKTVTSVAGDRRATAVSWFSLGGNIGIAVGPPLITTLVTGLGLAGSLGMLVPSLVVATLLLAMLPMLAVPAGARAGAPAAARGVNMPGAMALLILVVTVRSWTQLGFTTFVPFYYVDQLKADPRVVGPLLFVYLGAGALGTVIAGPLGDRFGPLRYMRWALVGAAPLGVLFLLTSGGWLGFVTLALFGGVLVSSFTMSVVLGQSYLPRNAGMASGLVVGFAIGTGGVGVTVLGWAADHYGLPVVLWISAVLPLLGFLLALFLPRPREAA